MSLHECVSECNSVAVVRLERVDNGTSVFLEGVMYGQYSNESTLSHGRYSAYVTFIPIQSATVSRTKSDERRRPDFDGEEIPLGEYYLGNEETFLFTVFQNTVGDIIMAQVETEIEAEIAAEIEAEIDRGRDTGEDR